MSMLEHSIKAGAIGCVLFLGSVAAASQPVDFIFRSFDLRDASATGLLGINAQHEMAGRYLLGSGFHGFVLSKGTVTTIDPPFGLLGTAQAWGINPKGEIVGLYVDRGTIAGGDKFRTRGFFRDTSGNFTPLDFPGAENTFAIKISSTGQVVGCYHQQDADFDLAHGGTMHGYVYQNGSYESLPVPGTMNNGIARDGQLIVGVWYPTPSEFHAYKVENGVYSLLDLPSYAVLSDARDVNAAGEIVGFFIDASNKSHGFLLNSAGFTPIDFPGADAIFTRAFGIDPEGNIVGLYITKDGRAHGFVAAKSPGQANAITLP